jgi:hypothetical protein
MPFTGRQKTTGRPHLLSLRNVAHSANDGTAVFFARESVATPSWRLANQKFASAFDTCPLVVMFRAVHNQPFIDL